MVIQENLTVMEKLEILSDAAKYDAACTSSGVDKSNNGQGIGNAKACGICHSFSADGRCISLLKILLTNECIFDCKYCVNRASNDVVRATFTPEEVCSLTLEFYRRNYIEGLFLSSGIIKSPDNTMRLMYETVMLLREKYHFGGYIHIKAIPGASQDSIEAAGWYTDRMSINLELPTADGLKRLAPHKNRKSILTPMRQIQQGIAGNRRGLGMEGGAFYGGSNSSLPYLSERDRNMTEQTWGQKGIVTDNLQESVQISGHASSAASGHKSGHTSSYMTEPAADRHNILLTEKEELSAYSSLSVPGRNGRTHLNGNKKFVPAGQSTQMIIGATEESDYQIVTVAEALYKSYDLKRVFYSAFINVNQDSSLPVQQDGKGVPLLREHRLYQADWLLRYYGFQSSELLSEEKPNFNVLLDPKCDWAIRHLEQFPVEINRADYYTLLRVPGVGVNSARRIMKARRSANLDFTDIKRMGVVLKRALYFITCNGRMMYHTKIEENYITNGLIGEDKRKIFELENHQSYRQLSLFDDVNFSGMVQA